MDEQDARRVGDHFAPYKLLDRLRSPQPVVIGSEFSVAGKLDRYRETRANQGSLVVVEAM